MNDYRTTVIKALEVLVDARGYIFAEVLNLASKGEMYDVMSVFEEGDSYDFELAHFENMEDKNIDKLINLCKHIESVYEQIKDDNNILSEEIFPDDEN